MLVLASGAIASRWPTDIGMGGIEASGGTAAKFVPLK